MMMIFYLFLQKLKSDSWEAMGFNEQFLVWMGRAKMARWGQGAVNSTGKRLTNVRELAEKRKTRVRTGSSGLFIS